MAYPYPIASLPFITGIEEGEIGKIESLLGVGGRDGGDPQTIRSAKGQLMGGCSGGERNRYIGWINLTEN